MPWIHHARNEQPDFLDCSKCVERAPKAVRASMNCGWAKPCERTGPGILSTKLPPDYRVGDATSADVCPGWLIQSPQANEAVRASGWAKDGLLREFYEGEEPTGLLFDCMDIVRSSISELEAHVLKGPK